MREVDLLEPVVDHVTKRKLESFQAVLFFFPLFAFVFLLCYLFWETIEQVKLHIYDRSSAPT